MQNIQSALIIFALHHYIAYLTAEVLRWLII
jgi:hypothetical protein